MAAEVAARMIRRGWAEATRSTLAAGAALLLALATSACTSLDTRIAEPRGRSLLDDASLGRMESALGIERHRFQVPDGPELAYRVVKPLAYGMEYRFARSDDDISFRFNLSHSEDERTPVEMTGTVVLLHGWGMDGSSMLPWALGLAERGWRTIMVDLRNHGASGRAPVGFGPREGLDVAALLNALPEAGDADHPLALLGVSYGGVAALYAAAYADAGQVDAVIAMSPYANAADGIHGMIEGMKAQPGSGLRGRLALAHARRRYDDARIARAIQAAGDRLGVDLATIDVRQAAAAVPACTLLLHGTRDGFFPMEDVQSLADAAPHGQLVALEGEHHFTTPMRLDWLVAPIAQWLDSVGDAECAAFHLPPPPDPDREDASAA